MIEESTGSMISGILLIAMILLIALRLGRRKHLILNIIVLYSSICFIAFSGVYEIAVITAMIVLLFTSLFGTFQPDRSYQIAHVDGYVNRCEEARIEEEGKRHEKNFLGATAFFIPIALIPTFFIVIPIFIGYFLSIIAYVITVLSITIITGKGMCEIGETLTKC